jgi:hypothetical protein
VEGIRSVFISVGGTWDEMVIEIMEPLDKSDMDNALSRRLARAGEGFYHLCIEVDDVEASGKELEARGMTVLMRDPVDPGDSPRWLVHPKDANGVMVESVARAIASAPQQPAARAESAAAAAMEVGRCFNGDESGSRAWRRSSRLTWPPQMRRPATTTRFRRRS